MPTLEDYIRNNLPYLLPTPRSRADLLAEAERLYRPKYDELTSETGQDFDLERDAYGRSRSRLIEDLGTSEALVGRQREKLAVTQPQAQVALKERLATQGLNFGPGLGDLQRDELRRQQIEEQQGVADAAAELSRSRNRGLEDINLGLSDTDRRRQRALRGVTRDRASAIEGYVTDPRFVFPYQ